MAGKHDGRLESKSCDRFIERVASPLQSTDHHQVEPLPELGDTPKRFNDPHDVLARLRASRG